MGKFKKFTQEVKILGNLSYLQNFYFCTFPRLALFAPVFCTFNYVNFFVHGFPQSKMYKNENIEDIEFRVLEDEKSLSEKWKKENGLSYQYFEIAELAYIETLKPLYNVCGVSREYLEIIKIDIEDREELKEKIADFVKENKESIENLKRE